MALGANVRFLFLAKSISLHYHSFLVLLLLIIYILIVIVIVAIINNFTTESQVEVYCIWNTQEQIPATLSSPSQSKEAIIHHTDTSVGEGTWLGWFPITRTLNSGNAQCLIKNRRITRLSHSPCHRMYLSLSKSTRNPWACARVVSACHN